MPIWILWLLILGFLLVVLIDLDIQVPNAFFFGLWGLSLVWAIGMQITLRGKGSQDDGGGGGTTMGGAGHDGVSGDNSGGGDGGSGGDGGGSGGGE